MIKVPGIDVDAERQIPDFQARQIELRTAKTVEGVPVGGGGGTGNVVGPASATADDIATFNGITGKLIKDSGSKVSDLIPKSIVTAKGDLIGATASGVPAAVPVGTNGQVLTADSTNSKGVSYQTPTTFNVNTIMVSPDNFEVLTSPETLNVLVSGA